uniref:Neutrophil cytosolic factor 2 n=1 Tax=Chelydra serpentina TaxID=8475 RepID=A0A8C3T9A8_CHESE
MSLAETIRLWNEGVCATDRKDWTAALDAFTSVQNPPSKLCFNIGCIHLILGNLAEAEQAFARSINCDKHLAVAYFQRGTVFYRREKYELAIEDFKEVLALLRGNQLIDYKILGLPFRLFACEVRRVQGLGVFETSEGKKDRSQAMLEQAVLSPRIPEKQCDFCVLQKHRLFEPVAIPPGKLFRPNEKQVAQLEKKDYLGKATVGNSSLGEESTCCFLKSGCGTCGPPPRPKTPEILRALEGEPHRVLYEFTPETAEELQVLPGNIVFVLRKGKDNWATVVFNGKVLRAHSTRGLCQATGSASRAGSAPGWRPVSRAGSETRPGAVPAMISVPPYVLKVHYKYTVAIPVRLGITYSELLDMVCKKLELSSEHTKLRYRPAESEELVTLSEESMKTVWNHAKDYCLTLWCDITEVSFGNGGFPQEGEDGQAEEGTQKTPAQQLEANHVVARYSYEAIQPEDLEFQAGDVILVLSKVNEEWLEGQCKGKVGIFPRAFVQKSDAENPEI